MLFGSRHLEGAGQSHGLPAPSAIPSRHTTTCAAGLTQAASVGMRRYLSGMQIMHGAKTVFRHNLMAGLVVGANVILVPFFVVALAPAVGTAVGAAVVASILWVLWLLGWWSKVVIGPSGVIVDNLILRHVIPWEQLRDIRADGGLTFELMDSTSVFSLSYAIAGRCDHWLAGHAASPGADARFSSSICGRCAASAPRAAQPGHDRLVASGSLSCAARSYCDRLRSRASQAPLLAC
jgi:hypothetical protein